MKKQGILIQNTSQFLIFLVCYLVVFFLLTHSYLIEKDASPFS